MTKDELEKRCDRCEGRGGETEQGQWSPCFECKGGGYIPTEIGKVIIDLVRHNLKWMLRDATDD